MAIRRGEAAYLEAAQDCATLVVPSLYLNLVVRDLPSGLSLCPERLLICPKEPNKCWAPSDKSVAFLDTGFPVCKMGIRIPSLQSYCKGSAS